MDIKNFSLVLHVLSGTLGSSATLWAMVELRQNKNMNLVRFRKACLAECILTMVSLVAAAVFYLKFYPEEKAIILKGPQPYAHTFYMEVKEHLFFILVLLSVFLLLVSRSFDPSANREQANILMTVLASIFILGFVMIAFGEMIDMGVKSGLIQQAKS